MELAATGRTSQVRMARERRTHITRSTDTRRATSPAWLAARITPPVNHLVWARCRVRTRWKDAASREGDAQPQSHWTDLRDNSNRFVSVGSAGGLSLVSQLVRFYSHTICPHQLTRPEVPLVLALRVLRFLVLLMLVVAAVGKWESRRGISKGRWERWETVLRFFTASTVPSFPRSSRFRLQGVSRCVPSAA